MILATSNLHKVREMRELLPGLELEPLPEGYESPVEDGDSFEANALIKARAAHAALGGAVLADDSGIEAFDLGRAPGIYSALVCDAEALERVPEPPVVATATRTGASAFPALPVCTTD